jgi:hypothetical protein
VFHEEQIDFEKVRNSTPPCNGALVKELNPRRRVYVEIPKPSRVKPKRNISNTREGFGISS